MNNKMYVCEKCICVFQIHSRPKKNRPYCPSCGDGMEVRKYQADRTTKRKKGEKIVKPIWTPPELALVDRIIAGELQGHQVSIMIGRSINSVNKKVARRREELAKV